MDLNKNHEIAAKIHSTMDDIIKNIDVGREIYNTLPVEHIDIIQKLKLFELMNYEPAEKEKIENIDELQKKGVEIMKYFDKYIDGSTYFEDSEWMECEKCEYFTFNKNQKGFFNTFPDERHYDKNLINYMDLITKYIKKFISNESKINVYFKFEEYSKYEMYWVIIIFEKIEK